MTDPEQVTADLRLTYFEISGLSTNQYTSLVVLGTCGAVLSLLGSSCIIWITSKQLNKIYQRLMLALSMSDILVSVSFILSPYLFPTYTAYPFAAGNVKSCSAIGFFFRSSIVMAALFSCTLSLYFFLVVTITWRDEKISKWLGKPAYVICPLLPLTFGAVGLALTSFNPRTCMGVCDLADFPADCSLSNGETTCVRGQHALTIDWVTIGLMCFSTLMGILATISVYWTVRRHVRRASKEERKRHQAALQGSNPEQQTTSTKIKSTTVLERNLQRMGTQAVLYSLAFLNSLAWPAIVGFLSYRFVGIQGSYDSVFFVFQVLAWLFFPLQGFFNFLFTFG